MLKPGDVAPDFELPNADLEMVHLEDLKGNTGLILFFYPKDDTPGCTIESLEFSDLDEEFSRHGFQVFGISRDDCESHGKFRDKHGLMTRLLSDVDGTMCEAYGVWREKEARGVVRAGILRSTFIVYRDGVVRHTLYDVKPKGHADQVLELVKALG